MLSKAGQLDTESSIMRVLEDALSLKALGTCTKRLGDYLRFARWILKQGSGRPMAPTESDCYRYITWLADSSAAPTTAQSFVKSVGFVALFKEFLVSHTWTSVHS